MQCNSTNSNIRDSTIVQSSPDNNDQTHFTVESTDPKDNENNVALDTEITVTFSEKIDKNTIDTESVTLFNLDAAIDPNIQSVSVSGKSATFTLQNSLLPNTHYQATISSSVEDQNGNFLECSRSSGVDSNCHWDFTTSGTSLSPVIALNPTSGPPGTTVTVTGTGFDPCFIVSITFGGTSVATTPATVTTTSSGEFSGTFNIPLSSSNGDHTVKATQGANSASKTFTVTSSVTPIITLNPTSGPVGTPVNITGTGFSPSSTVTIAFGGSTVTTTPFPVTTNNNGEFSATFTVPASSSGSQPVVATQGSNSASKTFTVTEPSSFAATSRSMNIADVVAESEHN